MKRLIQTAAFFLAAVCAPAHAIAETCTAIALPVAFGGYNPLSAAATDSTGQVTVTCTGIVSVSVSYTIKLSTGGSGTYSPRKLAFGAGVLDYNLYTNSSRTTVWGDGAAATSFISDSYALGLLSVTRNYTAYARLPPLQNVAAGVYADTITVTVTY